MVDIPNIRLFGDKRAGIGYIRPARQMLARLRARLDAGGVDSGGTHGRLADGVYCYARIGMGVSTIGIVTDSQPEEADVRGIDRAMVPDFLSGIAYTGEFDATGKKLDDFRPSQDCARLFNLPVARQEMKRLGVEIHDTFPEMADEERRLTQYAKLRPTMYSGTMRKMVQLLMGYGFLPDPEEDEESIYGEEFVRKVDRKFEPPPTEWERMIRKRGLQIQYDYRFARTHGLVRAADDKWWVVEIADERGVHAMPIELYKATIAPESGTDAFRAKLEEMGDEPGIAVLDLLGGFPVGAPFPSSDEELEAKVRAGMILKGAEAADLEEFYELEYYSTACGWAFSESGAWAVNTGWKYGPDEVQIGEYHKVQMVIGEMDEIIPPAGSVSLKRKLVLGCDGRTKRLEAALFKVNRMSDSQVREYLAMDANEAFTAVDDLVVEPIAEFSADVGRHGAGKIFWPTTFCPQIKFWEPLLGYLLSHKMRPRIQRANPNLILCDTIMHAFFIGEELNFVKFYKGPVEEVSEFEDGFDACMYSGEWTQVTRTGLRGVPAMFYTSRLDHREEFAPTEIRVTLQSLDLGYTSCVLGDYVGAPYLSYMRRHKSFLRTATTLINQDRGLGSAVCVPEGMREAYYYALLSIEPSKSKTVVRGYDSLTDPNWYEGWRNLPGFTGFMTTGGRHNPDPHPAGCGLVYNRHVWLSNYEPTACGEHADSGGWASTCQQMEPMVFNINLPSLPYTSENESNAILTVSFVANIDHETIECRRQETATDFNIGMRWFRPSPDPETFVKDYIYARANAFGSSDLVVYCSDINEYLNRKVGAPDVPVNSINHNYIGVFNG